MNTDGKLSALKFVLFAMMTVFLLIKGCVGKTVTLQYEGTEIQLQQKLRLPTEDPEQSFYLPMGAFRPQALNQYLIDHTRAYRIVHLDDKFKPCEIYSASYVAVLVRRGS